MSTPLTSTLLLLNLPPSILCGIDLLTFNTSPTFLGIKTLSPGLHFLFTSPSPSLSLREGFWFLIPSPSPSSPPPILHRKWDPEHETLVPCSEDEARQYVNAKGGWKEVYDKNLTPYRQSTDGEGDKEDAWSYLTEHVTPELLDHFSRDSEWGISSASSGVQDRDVIPGLSAREVDTVIGEEKELGMLGIDLKRTWREGAVGRERTEQARDRSWYLGDLVTRNSEYLGRGVDVGEEQLWANVILGQMEICFLMVLTLANYSCLEEWKRILAVVLTCEKAVWEKPRFFATFLRLLKRQLERGDDVEGGLFDMSDDGGGFLKGLLRGFKRTLEQRKGAESSGKDDEDVKEEFEEVEKWVRVQYGWELGDEFVRRGMLELEDGEMVEMETGEMEEEDESGEYAPVVVEL
ncbi:MAG: hypothetical protein LQ343_001072 [Gyalolechia ehrenbergii]|nr:MAG: hypothetical protein LQ343_001072 [Gyalolechia ehrenbergii]